MPGKASLGRCSGGVVEVVEAVLVADSLRFPFSCDASPRVKSAEAAVPNVLDTGLDARR
jgi:hypothetical protein